MPRYRVCKTFVVESAHMLSKHPGRCRFPHGHTRTFEVVVSSEKLDQNEMVIDFKALKLAIEAYFDAFDHAIVLNSNDPLLPAVQATYPQEGWIVFENEDPTTEVMARRAFEVLDKVATEGWKGQDPEGVPHAIKPGIVRVERVRVWETQSSWAEYGL